MMDLIPGSPLWKLYIYAKSVGLYRHEPEIDYFWLFLLKITVFAAFLTFFGTESRISPIFGTILLVFFGFFAKMTVFWAICVIFQVILVYFPLNLRFPVPENDGKWTVRLR